MKLPSPATIMTLIALVIAGPAFVLLASPIDAKASSYYCTRLDPSRFPQLHPLTVDVIVGQRTSVLRQNTVGYGSATLSALAPGTPISVWVISYGSGNPDSAGNGVGSGMITEPYPTFDVSVSLGGVSTTGQTRPTYLGVYPTVDLTIPAVAGPQTLQVSFDTPLNGFSCKVNGVEKIDFTTSVTQPAETSTSAASPAIERSVLSISYARLTAKSTARGDYKARKPRVVSCRRNNKFTVTCRVDWKDRKGPWTISVRVWNSIDGYTYYSVK